MPEQAAESHNGNGAPPRRNRTDWKDSFAIPAPIRRTFAQFPLRTYSPNSLPARSPYASDHVLCIFTTSDRASRNRPSFNPTCLKWQTYLKMCGVRFSTVAANNHAAPGGQLPFLLSRSFETVPCAKLGDWAEAQGRRRTHGGRETEGQRAELYLPLLEHRIRRAWLCQMYFDAENFEAVARRLYIDSASSSWFVRAVTGYQLRRAATAELARTSAAGVIDVETITDEAEEAFETLSVLLGHDESWFFSAKEPGVFDAAVFAYTHLLLDDETMRWRNNRLGGLLKRHENLIRHRARIVELHHV